MEKYSTALKRFLSLHAHSCKYAHSQFYDQNYHRRERARQGGFTPPPVLCPGSLDMVSVNHKHSTTINRCQYTHTDDRAVNKTIVHIVPQSSSGNASEHEKADSVDASIKTSCEEICLKLNGGTMLYWIPSCNVSFSIARLPFVIHY